MFVKAAARRVIAAAVACAAAVAIAAPAPSATLDPYELNAIIPVTGGGAFLGKSYLETFHAIEVLVNRTGGIQGHPLKFVTQDTQTSGQVDVQLVNALIAKHVPAFIDGAPSTVCLPSIPLVEKTGPVDYCLSPVIRPPAGGYVFSTMPSTFDLASSGFRFMREHGWKRIAMITSTDSTGQDYDREVQRVLALPENHDLQLVAQEHFNTADISVTAQLTRMKAANPQMIFAITTGTPLATVLRGIRDQDLGLPVMTNNPNMTYAQMAAYAAFLPKALYFPSVRSMTPEGTMPGPLRDAQTAYQNAYKAIGVKPDAGDVLAWDPAMMIVAALRKNGTNATAEQIRDYILHLHGWIGANGVYDFSGGDQRGLTQNSIVIAQWSPAKNTWIQVSQPRGFLH